MNPFEEIDPDDKQSYANASLVGRISAIVAGPARELPVRLRVLLYRVDDRGRGVPTTGVQVLDGPAKSRQMQDGDIVQTIDGQKVSDWEDLRAA